MRKLVIPVCGLVLFLSLLRLSNLSRRDSARHSADRTRIGPAAETGVSARQSSASSPNNSEAKPVTVAQLPTNAAASAQAAPTNSAAPEAISAKVLKQIEALQAAKLQRTATQHKLDSQLIDAEKLRRGEPIAEGIPALRLDFDKDDEGRVLTDIDAKVSAELLERIAMLWRQSDQSFCGVQRHPRPSSSFSSRNARGA
jgi:hypothetical protein